MRATPPVIVRTPLSRRKVLMAAGGGAAVIVALRLASLADRTERRTGLPAPPPRLAVAIPSGGDSRDQYTNRPLLSAVQRVLDDVRQAGQGRFELSVEEIAQPAPSSPPDTPTPQLLVLAPLMASGAPPDLVAFTSQANAGAIPREFAFAADTGALLPLDAALKGNAALALSDFYPAALDVCRTRGTLLGVPLLAMPLFLTYDERRFADAGVAPPDATWGWAQLLDAARRLTSIAPGGGARDQYGFIPSSIVASLLALIWQNGGDAINAAGTRAMLSEPRAREAISFFASFYEGTPASPREQVSGVAWSADGARANGRWWAAMTQTASPGSTASPVPGVADLLRGLFGGWVDGLLGAIGQDKWRWVRFAPLPRGRQRATALGVTATLSVTHKAKDPDAAAAALALLSEHTSRSVVPSARRLSVGEMQRLAPHYPPEQIQLLADSLAEGRVLVAGDHARTNRVLGALRTALVEPIQRQTRPLDETVELANGALQAILDTP